MKQFGFEPRRFVTGILIATVGGGVTGYAGANFALSLIEALTVGIIGTVLVVIGAAVAIRAVHV